ncbi:MAG: FAD-dependent oxidoreductase [Alphaproteobacteria bacterium]|nr:MAG: FAD-dependent oxidoreductase [Alphaproteobacteria bacterium]
MSAADSGAAPHIAILGAGPAGVAAAYKLGARGFRVSVFERAAGPGGNSSSFPVAGVICDYGSHRFHPVAEPAVLADVKALLGEDLLLRPRHGRIRLGGRWIHFPLKPVDALINLPKPFAASLMLDAVVKRFRKAPEGPATFASVLEAGLGPTIARNFYFPYVRKLWGLAPEELAVTLAERRVSGSSVGRILAKMIRQLPGLRSPTAGRFYYPKKGFGQIITTMAERAAAQGAEFHYGAQVAGIEIEGGRAAAVAVETEAGRERVVADRILSTIPISTLVRLTGDAAPAPVQAAAKALRSRGMILIYLVLKTDRFTEYDAHYFPELSVPISRMSEPKNYSASREPAGRTVLCAELPADPGDRWWQMSDAELGEAYVGWLEAMGLPVTCAVLGTETRRLTHAYPVYDLDFQRHFSVMDDWLSGLEGLMTFGRQGLFAHDNTHHAFAMAYGAADCLDAQGGFDAGKWAGYRREFESHVVED